MEGPKFEFSKQNPRIVENIKPDSPLKSVISWTIFPLSIYWYHRNVYVLNKNPVYFAAFALGSIVASHQFGNLSLDSANQAAKLNNAKEEHHQKHLHR